MADWPDPDDIADAARNRARQFLYRDMDTPRTAQTEEMLDALRARVHQSAEERIAEAQAAHEERIQIILNGGANNAGGGQQGVD